MEGKEEKGKEKVKEKMMLMVGKRGGPTTPSPTWRLQFSSPKHDTKTNPIQEFLKNSSEISARKLCANLWEIHPQLHLPETSRNFGPRRRARRRGHCKDNKAAARLVDSSPKDSSALPQPASASTFRRHATTSVMQHRRPVEGNVSALEPLSSASHASSMEVAPYKPAITPTSSLDFNGRMGESSYSLKTSAQLLKVLNRIWTLEEQQASNMSLLKAVKKELDRSRFQIKELLREKEINRGEMDDLMKQVTEDNIIRKSKVQDRIKAAVGSVQEELEDERKLRKHSETLHRKLARELSEVKSSFSGALKQLERERKARILLENLCDEFANGIREYEQEVRSLRHKLEMDNIDREKTDHLVLHISETWLDERMQMKLAEAKNDSEEKNSIIDKLSLDIETFLQARHSAGFRRDISPFAAEARRESFPLNEATSAPQHAADEEDSTDGNSGCFELNNSTCKKQTIGSHKPQTQNASKSHIEEARGDNQAVGSSAGTSGNIFEATGDSLQKRKSKQAGTHRFSSSHVLDSLIRNHSLSSEGDKIHPEDSLKDDFRVEPVFAGKSSPVQPWMSKLTSPPEFDKSEHSLKLGGGSKENTLEAKLLEARLESKKSRSRTCKA